MMRIALKVAYVDGREQAVMVSGPDLIAFERQFDKPMTTISSGRIEYLYWATWHSLKRRNLVTAEFDEWVDTVDGVTDDEAGSADLPPLESKQPIGS